MSSKRKPIEVAIIGGGCAAITAAFELTRPEHEHKYHVTIYQLGWRLGGKGASGRGPADRKPCHGYRSNERTTSMTRSSFPVGPTFPSLRRIRRSRAAISRNSSGGTRQIACAPTRSDGCSVSASAICRSNLNTLPTGGEHHADMPRDASVQSAKSRAAAVAVLLRSRRMREVPRATRTAET